MKLEAGKYFKTRDGRKAYVAAIAPEEIGAAYPAIGWLGDQLDNWLTDGRYMRSGNDESEDLIAEWIEPEAKAEWCLYAYKDRSGNVYNYDTPLPEPRLIQYDYKFLGRIKLEPME